MSASEAPPVVGVRPATSNDVQFIADANRAAQRAVVTARGGALDNQLLGRQEPIEDTIVNDIDAESTEVRLGMLDAHSVGYLVVHHVAMPDGTALAQISDLWVHPEARSVGVGAALLLETEFIAREWGASGLESRALPGDRTTKNFFESFGLKARLINVHRALD